MSAALEQVAALVHAHTGIAIKERQLPSLAGAVARVASGMTAEGFLAELNAKDHGGMLIDRLIDQVTVKETYFFRAPREFLAIPWRTLWDAAQARGDHAVRVWIAACATGEEAYTLAMLAHEAFGGSPPVSIVATDISDAALARAREARYTDRSVASLPHALRERYIRAAGTSHTPVPAITELVTFRRHNLITDGPPPPGAFDVVACRNVLIYFDAPTVERTTARLEAAVQPGGSLILGAADRLPGTARLLARVAAGRPLRRRRRRPPARPPVTPAPLPESVIVTVRPEPDPAPIAAALAAADRGDIAAAIELTGPILAADPLDAEAHFVRGLAELVAGALDDAVSSLRRALYVDPRFALAAFQLGRAYDALDDERAARRAYGQALSAIDPADDRHAALLGQVGLSDIADACRARLLSGRARR